jgi:hypothetical protein
MSHVDTLALTPALVRRVEELKAGSHKPASIVKLSDEIAGEMRVAALRVSITGATVDRVHAAKIADMRGQLDGLYIAWLKGDIS